MTYQERIAEAQKRGLFKPRKEPYHPSVHHEQGCALIAKVGDCDCTPDIRIRIDDELYVIDPLGIPELWNQQ